MVDNKILHRYEREQVCGSAHVWADWRCRWVGPECGRASMPGWQQRRQQGRRSGWRPQARCSGTWVSWVAHWLPSLEGLTATELVVVL